MESPKTRLTNVHQIEGVLSVQWSVYKSSVQVSTSRIGGENLTVAESELRQNGHHVFHEPTGNELWHFTLPRDLASSEESSSPVEATEILNRHSLTRSLDGFIQASDINESLNRLHQDLNQVVIDPFSTDQHSSVTDAKVLFHLSLQSQDSKTSPNPSVIYTRFLAAIEKSVAYNLFSTGSWLPVASSLVAQRQVPDSSDTNDGALCQGDRWSILYTIKASWLPSGVFVVACAKLSPALSTNRFRLPETVNCHAQVVVTPLGIVADLRDVKARSLWPQVWQSSFLEWKELIINWLQARGVVLIAPDTWVLLRMETSEELEVEDNLSVASIEFPWPGELCYSLPRTWTSTTSTTPSSNPVKDFLAEAEIWKAGKTQRDEATREQQQKKKPVLEEDVEEVDDYIHLFPKVETMLDVQAMTGIYPTPPDGIPHTNNTDDRQEQHPDTNTPGEPDTKTPKVTFDETVDSDMGLDMDDKFDHIDDDDLFGTMRSSEYGNNGVTDDDFNFFDEPGDTPAGHFSNPSSVAQDHTADTTLAESPEIHEKAERLAISDDFETHEISPDVIVPAPKQELDSQSKDNMEWEKTPNESTPVEVPGSTVKTHFDSKYGSKGKFQMSSQISGPHSTAPNQGPKVQNQIPSISKANNDDSDDSDSDSESSSNSPIPGVNLDNKRKLPDPESLSKLEEFEDYSEDGSDTDAEVWAANNLDRFIQLLENLSIVSDSSRQHTLAPPSNLDHYVRLAQLFADQMIYYKIPNSRLAQRNHSSETDYSTDSPLHQVMAKIFPIGTTCSLEKLAMLEDPASTTKVPAKHNLKRSDTGKSEIVPPDPIFPIHPPSIRTRRGDKKMEVSYVALRFWEDLGLSPFSGPKNVQAFCMFPDSTVSRRGARSFLTLMNSTYTSLRLGTHDAGHAAMKGCRDGLVAMPTSEDQGKDSTLNRTCERLGRALQTLATQRFTIVLYIFNDKEQAEGVRTICSAFMRLFDVYAANLRFTSNPCDIVLKVLPMSWIASSWNVAIPSVNDLVSLAKEIYDRCPLEGEASSPYASVSLAEIAEPVPKSLDFKLTYESQVNPFHRKTFAHVAYCWDIDSPWITASLTDSLGCHSWAASFSAGNKVDRWAVFTAVTKEIVDIVAESVEDSHGKVRLVICKDSAITQDEKDCWLEACDESVILLQTDSSPGIYLLNNHPSPPAFDPTSMVPPAPTTPDVSSPDPGTPKLPDEFDPNARAVDLNEEAWGVIMNKSSDPEQTEAPPLVPHGYLVKRGNTVLSLRVIHADIDVGMREMLIMMQGLICLAKARGLEGEVPCHMAFARRAQKALSEF